MNKLNLTSPHPLTALQEGMLLHSIAYSGSGIDIEQIVISQQGAFEPAAWQTAWQQLLQRHPILRSSFEWQHGQSASQTVQSDVAMPITWLAEPITSLTDLLAADRKRDFDTTTAPLMRLTMFTHATKAYCLWTFHHVLLDGRSFPIVLQELFTIYDALLEGRVASLSEREPFNSYLDWYAEQDFAHSKPYWREQLADREPLVLDFATGGEEGDSYAKQLSLSAEITNSLQTFAQQQNVTLNTLVQAAWGLLLMHYGGTNDVTFGNTRAGRHANVAGVADMVGLLINTVPVRVQVSAETTLTDYLQALRQQHVTLRKHEHSPLTQIQKWSGIAADTPLFNTLVVFENYLLNSRMQALGGSFADRSYHYFGKTNFPLALICYADDGLLLRLEYDNTCLNAGDINRLLRHLRELLSNFLTTASDTPALSVPYLPPQDKQRLLHQWNTTPVAPAETLPLHVQFERQVAAAPDALAVTFEGVSLTYAQLNEQANQLAHHLLAAGVQPNALIGLSVDRSLDIVVGILGILKAGAAYVPLDPASPQERQQFIANDAALKLIIVRNTNPLGDAAGNTQLIDLNELPPNLPTPNPQSPIPASSLAYVIYTSGSTGKPKGALVTHANVSRLFSATEQWFNFNQDDVWTLFHSYAFDFSVWELWGALLYGGRVVVVPYWISRDPAAYHSLLSAESVTILNQTPTAFRQLIQADAASSEQLALRSIVFGGEALELPSLRPWVEKYGDDQPQLINMYGITETTVHVTYRRIRAADIVANRGSMIGAPIPDLQVYVLDERLEPVPLGVVGELYVGGAGVSNGYLNRPKLTAERFINNPFNPHSKLYKTGDIARRLPNGDIEYIGRADQQVKIRGFRIELGEIEAVLAQHEAVADAVVIADMLSNTDIKQLIAYVIADDSLDTDKLRSFANQQLPDYMLPAFIVPLNAFPLTNNGKLNRKKLPRPEPVAEQKTYAAPSSELEQILTDIWQDVLRLPQIGVHDNFFALGGDSILSIQIIARLRQSGWQITPRQIFQHRTIAELAQVTEPIKTTDIANIAVTGSAPLTPIQQWFLSWRCLSVTIGIRRIV